MKTRKPKLPSIQLLLAVILAIAVVEIANLLVPIPTTGSVTIKDEIGESSHPELPFFDIVETTVEKNETNLTIVIKVNGNVPNQTESSEERTVAYTYYFQSLIHLELKGIGWTPMLGHTAYMQPWKADYAGQDFPGSFLIDQETRTIQIMLDLDFLREREIRTDVTSDTFTWSIGTYVETRVETQMGSSGEGYTVDRISSYFPDYLSFYRPVISALALIVIVLGGMVWWQRTFIWDFLTGKQYRQISPPKQVRILGVIYRLQSVYWLSAIVYFLYMAYILAGDLGPAAILGPLLFFAAFCFSFVWYAFIKTAGGILRGSPWAKHAVLILSTLAAIYGLAAIFGFYTPVTNIGELYVIVYPFLWRLGCMHGYPLVSRLIDLILGATSLLCIFYLRRPQVRAFLNAESNMLQHQ